MPDCAVPLPPTRRLRPCAPRAAPRRDAMSAGLTARTARTACAMVAAVAAACATAPSAATAAPARPPAPQLTLPSCVKGSPGLTVPVRTPQAALQAADRQTLQRAAEDRYPLYQQGGLHPHEVLLLQRDGHWQYVALRPDGPQGRCFYAVFAADRFAFTASWLARYRPRPVDPGD